MVDDQMRTNDPDIYAGGDCVENVNLLSKQKVFSPMGSTANKHGRVIGENLCGGNVTFKGVLNTVVVKIHSLSVGKTGLTEREAKQLATTISPQWWLDMTSRTICQGKTAYGKTDCRHKYR